jgi:hypothetical protein
MSVAPLEKLRRIWSPGREIEEVVANLEPSTYLDSQIRQALHLVIQQKGPQTIDIGSEIDPSLCEGTLRWEMVHGPGPDEAPELRRRQLAIWVEK